MSVSKVITIEISDLVTKVCEMDYETKNPTIYKSTIFSNPKYSVDDGFIADRPAYEEEFKTKIAEAGIKCKDAVFVLSSNKIISREITIPEMKEELISELIENERGEYFPMDTSEHVFSFTVLEKMKADKQMRVNVFAAPELLIKNYQALAAELDLKIAALDYYGNALYQWLKRPGHEQMDMYLQINEKNAMFTILENGVLALQRNMNFGTSVLISNMLDEGCFEKDLGEDGAMLKLIEEKLLYGSFAEMDEADPDTEEEAKLHELKKRLTEVVRPFIANISRVLEYYNTKNRDAKVSKIYVGGIGASVVGLKELIESEFNGVEIETVAALPTVKFSKKNIAGRERATEFTACYGASLLTVNFFKVNAQAKMEKTLIFSIVAVAVVMVAAVFIVLNGKMKYDEALTRQAKLEIQQAQIEANGIEVLENEYLATQSSVAEVEAMDAATFNYNEYWNDILGYLETESVKNVIITSISSSDSNLTLNVVVNTKEEAAKLLLQYQKIPYFSDIQISGIAENTDEEAGLSTVSFTLSIDYNMLYGTETATEEVAD